MLTLRFPTFQKRNKGTPTIMKYVHGIGHFLYIYVGVLEVDNCCLYGTPHGPYYCTIWQGRVVFVFV